jgi:hypothetical protein
VLTARARLLVLLACLGAAVLALWCARPPAPRPADAPAREFSALRAHERLAALLGDEAPHPVGSAANTAVRTRLIAELVALGLTPEEQRGFMCDADRCAPVVNVLVRVKGIASGPAVMLSAHYDSVGAGPGAADDGSGVAVILESLRALLADGTPATPLMAVFTDGEEVGLLGAKLFAQSPAFAEVGPILNIEARGTNGAARMFETSDDNAGLIARFAAGVARPSAQSLSYEIYRLLPNDTDLSVFKRAGAQGLNFAFIGAVRRYHTPLDDLAHLDLGSVQQAGDAVLGAARALLAAPPGPPSGNASYADLLGLVLLRWPASFNLPLAGLGLVLVLIASVRARRRAHLSLLDLAASAASTVLAPVLGAAGALGAHSLIEAATGPRGSYPAGMLLPGMAAALAASFAAVLVLRFVARRVGAQAQALGNWLVWALLAGVVAWILPGASILWIAPTLLAGLALLLAGDRPIPLTIACAAAGALTMMLWAPLIPAIIEALGLVPLVIGAIVGLVCSAIAPAFAETGDEHDGRGLVGLLAFATAVLGLLSVRAPQFTPELPGKLNILHVQDLDRGEAHHVLDIGRGADPLPGEFATLALWERSMALPWSRSELFNAPAGPGSALGPSLEVAGVESGGELRRVTGTLHARPGARLLIALLPASLSSLRLDGRTLDLDQLHTTPDGRRMVTIFGPPDEGVPLIAELRGSAPWLLADGLSELPAGSRALVLARPTDRVPHQNGDLSLALRQVDP